MKPVKAILFEPVGCLAEFPAEPFEELAACVFGRKKNPARSGSRSYWHLLSLLESSAWAQAEPFELQAVAAASVYEDVAPALSELKSMNVQLVLASSLSRAAVTHFLDRAALNVFFSSSWDRERSGGVGSVPIQQALAATGIPPDQVMYLTDTAEGLKAAQSVGVPPVLMMNDPDEAQRLSLQGPAGGIVSLHELPDFLLILGTGYTTPK